MAYKQKGIGIGHVDPVKKKNPAHGQQGHDHSSHAKGKVVGMQMKHKGSHDINHDHHRHGKTAGEKAYDRFSGGIDRYFGKKKNENRKPLIMKDGNGNLNKDGTPAHVNTGPSLLYSEIPDTRDKYLKEQPGYGVLKDPLPKKVDFQGIIDKHMTTYETEKDGKGGYKKTTKKDEGAQQFLDRYNNPITRAKMKKQIGVDDKDIDNMILQGLNAGKIVGDQYVKEGAAAEAVKTYGTNEYNTYFTKAVATHKPTETHERVHVAGWDEELGKKLQEKLGSAYDQTPYQKRKNSLVPQSVRSYLNQTHETYGNFADFREQLGIKPGEQIDVKRMNKIMKEKKIKTNFSDVYADDKIVEALNTIAYQGGNKNENGHYFGTA